MRPIGRQAIFENGARHRHARTVMRQRSHHPQLQLQKQRQHLQPQTQRKHRHQCSKKKPIWIWGAVTSASSGLKKQVVLYIMHENEEGKQRSKDQIFELIRKSIRTGSRVVSDGWKATCSIPWAALGMVHEFCIHSATKAAVEQKKADPNSKISVFNKRKQVAKLALKRAELIEKKAAAAKQAAAAKLLLTQKEKKAGKRIYKDPKKKAADAKVKKTKEHVKKITKPIRKKIMWVNQNGFHTNDIESEWNRCKKWARKVYGTLPREDLDLILGQYLFRRNLDAPAACTCKVNNKQQRSIECPACNLCFFESAMRAMNYCNIFTSSVDRTTGLL